MEKNDHFITQLLATFQVEADEHLKALTDGLISLESGVPVSEQGQIIERVFREAHSLKGAARSVSQQTIQDICQSLENVLSLLKNQKITLSAPLFDILHVTIDYISNLLSNPAEKGNASVIIKQLDDLSEENLSPEYLSKEPNQIKNSESREENIKKVSPKPQTSKLLKKENITQKSEALNLGIKQDNIRDKTIRIAVPKLDLLFQEVEEMLMVKLTSQQQVVDLKELTDTLHTHEKQFNVRLPEFQIQKSTIKNEDEGLFKIQSNEYLKFFEKQRQWIKSFKDLLNKTMKSAEQNSHFIGSMVDTLLEDMKKVLMQPLSTLFDIMPRMVRDLSHELGKEVKLEIHGGEIEVDRRILEEIKDPLIHLMRNAIDHGIESPSERSKKNKDSQGQIILTGIESDGNRVEISIKDDGNGINIEKLKTAAIKQGYLSTKEASELSKEEVIHLAFRSGISTSSIITDLSGRGLGLGIVAEKVEKLGGHLEIQSEEGKGTTFRLILPLTLATFRGIHITIENQEFIMPTHNVKRVIRIRPEDIKSAENLTTILFENQQIPFVYLADVLSIPSDKDQNKNLIFALVVKALEKTIAFGVDTVKSEQEVLIKGLGKQCLKIKNMMAATIMDWGKIIPILNPIDLVQTSIEGNVKRKTSKDLKKKEQKQKTILLAEDSITTRMLLKNVLENAGYDVTTAVDGLEALELLQSHQFDLLMTDVEMPRLDGFGLIEKLRSIPNLKELPVIICTARGSKEDRERGIDLGALAYLDKSAFAQQTLLNVIQNIL